MNKHLLPLPKMVLILLIGALLYPGVSARAATFTVNTTADTVDSNPGDGTAIDADGHCSLRAAIMEANALYGHDSIEIPVGTYRLTIEGTDEGVCRKGDLDICSHLTIKGAGQSETIIDGNQLDRVFHIKESWDVFVYDLTIRSGRAPDGENGQRGSYGGGIYNSGSLTMKRCTIHHNKAGDGSYAGYNSGNGSGGSGGGIYNTGTLILENCRISKNEGGKCGGGGYCNCYCDYYNGGHGGGIFNDGGTMTLQGCELSYNQAGGGGEKNHITGYPGYGGAIYNTGKKSKTTLSNCTVSHNSTSEYGYDRGFGGGIYNRGQISLLNCTVYRNVVRYVSWWGYGGGIYNCYQDSTAAVKDTILAANRVGREYQGPDFYGTMTSLGHNLLAISNGCHIIGDTDDNFLDLDPRLGPLEYNGGPTRTHRLLTGSPAIDAGNPFDFLETDQRGVYRPKDGDKDDTAVPDIGAFEKVFPQVTISQPMAGATVTGTANIKAVTNMQQACFYIDGRFLCTIQTAPHGFNWDTTLLANGSHLVRVKAFDIPDRTVSDTIMLNVRNVLIEIQALRKQEKGWLVRRPYCHIHFTVDHAGSAAPVKYLIYRREAEDDYRSIKEVPAAGLTAGSYTFSEVLPNPSVSYSYRVIALDDQGTVLGRSEEKTI